MTGEQPAERPRGDRMTTEFFENVLTKYLDEDRLAGGVLRLELEDGSTRRIVVDDDTESLGSHEYIKQELEELMFLVEQNKDLFDEPLQLSIPVDDTERVVTEAKSDGSVSTLFHAQGIGSLLKELHAVVDAKADMDDEDGDDE